MLKKGQRVRINSGGMVLEGCFDNRTGVKITDSECSYIDMDIGQVWGIHDRHLTPVEPSIDSLMVGDVLLNPEFQEQKVLFIGNDDYVVLSLDDEFNQTLGNGMTKTQMKVLNYKVTSPTPSKTVLTRKMIADKFGIDEDNMEIK